MAALAACSGISGITDGKPRLEVQNKLPRNIVVSVDSGAATAIAAGGSAAVAIGDTPKRLDWKLESPITGLRFMLSGGHVALSDTTRKVVISNQMGDSTIFLLQVENLTGDGIGVGLFLGGLGFCYPFPTTTFRQAIDLGFFNESDPYVLRVFRSTNCSDTTSITIPNSTILANVNVATGVSLVPVTAHP